MKNIKIALGTLIIGLAALWLAADDVPAKFFPLRTSLINLTGIIGIGAMSVVLILATRPIMLEKWLDGLDKGYRLHKWLGITALVMGVAHWLLAQGTKWAVGWGWLERPVRGPRVEESVALFRFFQSQRGLAESIGEWSFYAATILMVMALLKKLPYGLFRRLHVVLAALFLLLAFHSTILMKYSYWTQPVGPIIAVLVVAGCVSAVLCLFRRVGRARMASGVVARITPYPASKMLAVDIGLTTAWTGHQAGQFAFVTLDPKEGPHPFTIASSWRGDGQLTFMIKGIGDYTARLGETLAEGAPVTVEGPYGRFDFHGRKPRQIWVAGGVGITPFVARLQTLAAQGGGDLVDLVYSAAADDQDFIAALRDLADRAKVRLHTIIAGQDGRLTTERLCDLVPQWQQADVWFCGPAAFGHALRGGLTARGMSRGDFHQELFDMR